MKTMLIQGKQIPALDQDLLQAHNTSEAGTVIDDKEDFLQIGVENDEG